MRQYMSRTQRGVGINTRGAKQCWLAPHPAKTAGADMKITTLPELATRKSGTQLHTEESWSTRSCRTSAGHLDVLQKAQRECGKASGSHSEASYSVNTKWLVLVLEWSHHLLLYLDDMQRQNQDINLMIHLTRICSKNIRMSFSLDAQQGKQHWRSWGKLNICWEPTSKECGQMSITPDVLVGLTHTRQVLRGHLKGKTKFKPILPQPCHHQISCSNTSTPNKETEATD